MLRCRIPIAVLLILALPLQSFAGEGCCQSGGETCCSQPGDSQQTQIASCCSREKSPGESPGCPNCAAAKRKVETATSSVNQCRCQCKKSPSEPPVTIQRRQLSLAFVPTPHESLFVSSLRPVRTRLPIEVTDRSPGLRLHAINSVWLN